MLRAWDDGLTYSQIWQFVNVSSLAAWIDAGVAFTTAAASFNAHLPVPPGSAEVSVRIWASPVPYALWGTYVPTAIFIAPVTLDNNPATWQAVSGSDYLPVLTRYILFELAFRDDPLRLQAAVLHGYADCAKPKIVPELATMAAFAPGLLLFWLRKAGK